ncbi:PD40 domain-containing protein [Dactylosporangium fulvum]|uniref:hypothetical protein n=1 Tax=Dactylosporangium fulvum TaxID=53359 RepID=UPI0031D8F091
MNVFAALVPHRTGRRLRRALLAALRAAAPAGMALTSSQAAAEPARAPGSGRLVVASVGLRGEQSDAASSRVSLSRDGRFVVFTSWAHNLAPGNFGRTSHVYVRDLWTRTTELVDADRAGRPGDGNAWDGRVSDDGRYVAFTSDADNLAGDSGGHSHVYVRDLRRRTTTMVDVDVDAAGRPADRDSVEPQISADGAAVVFMSRGTRLAGTPTGGEFNVYLRDLRRSRTVLVSAGLDGAPADGVSYGPAVDASHRYVAFASLATNLVPGDANHAGDVFLRDLVLGTTVLVSNADGDVQGNDLAVGATISADGRYVGFASHATNLAPGLPQDHASHAFVRDVRARRTVLLDANADAVVADGGSTWTGVSADGRYAVFMSTATNLVPAKRTKQWDVFLRDLRTGELTLVSTGAGGAASDGDSWWPVLSADGRAVGFLGFGTTLTPHDTNGFPDVYVRFR